MMIIIAAMGMAKPKPITIAQQNQVRALQIEAYKVALQYKYLEILEIQLKASSQSQKTLDDLEATKKQKDAVNMALASWNEKINQLAVQIQKADGCVGCEVTPDFKWIYKK
jgi:hypothetical protein